MGPYTPQTFCCRATNVWRGEAGVELPPEGVEFIALGSYSQDRPEDTHHVGRPTKSKGENPQMALEPMDARFSVGFC